MTIPTPMPAAIPTLAAPQATSAHQNGSSVAASPLILVEATHAQHVAVRAGIFRDHERWRRGRSEQDYWIAEETMTGARLAERRAWVLVPEDDRETTDYRCTCLTFRFESLVTRTSPSSAPQVRSAPIYLIGGVFTPSPHRGHGHGGVMMRLLHEKLRPLTPNLLRSMSPAAAATAASSVSPRKDGSQYGNDAVCSVLWSDLETWYERNGGYKVKGWSDTVVSAVPVGEAEEGEDDADVDYITPEEIPQRFAQLANEDERLIRDELQKLASTTASSFSPPSPHPIISLISNRGESWRYSSLQSQLQVRFQSRPMPTSWGCQLKSSPTTWAIWAYGLLPPSSGEASSLNILRHRAENAESFFKLLQAARRAAARVEGCTRVVVWNVEDNSSPSSRYWPEAKARLEKEAGAKVWNEVRPTSRPAVAWYRDSGDDEDNDGVVRAQDAEPVRWINAEFGYCLAT